MGSEQQCGLGSLVPMSCRGRAEAFARRLHTRLRRLGAEPPVTGHDNTTWTATSPTGNNTDSDIFFDFDAEPESPSSPVEELAQNILVQPNHRVERESGCVLSTPVDNASPPSNSDSDATYYDIETDSESKLSNFMKLQKVYDESQAAAKGVVVAPATKLKLTSSTAEMIDQLFQNRGISPEKQSPIKTQPLARDNGFADYGSIERRDSQNSMYSAINFDDCQRRNSSERQLADTTNRLRNEDFSIDNLLEGERLTTTTTTTTTEKESSSIDESRKDDGESGLESAVEALSIDTTRKEDEDDDEEEETIVEQKETDSSSSTSSSSEIAVEEDVCQTTEQNDVQDCDAAEETGPPSDTQSNEGDDSDDRPQRVRRCSSLRTGKTPPGTPGRKKIVRFADVLGLDLADVKTFMDDIPTIPKSAFEDLQDAEPISSSLECFVLNEIAKTSPEKCLVPIFQQPGDQANFLDILNTKNVCLENACVQEGATIAVFGTVRVRNLDFHKSVQIRYTLDSWKTFSDLQASYVPNSCDGFSDRFQFLLYAHTVQVGQTLEFAVRFLCKGTQFWDNNSGDNYCFHCLSPSNTSNSFYIPSTLSPIDNWHASFY